MEVKKIFSFTLLANLYLFSHFQNDGATDECSTLVILSSDPVSNSMLLELKRGGRKERGKGQWRLLVKTNVCGVALLQHWGASLRLAPALQDTAKYMTVLPSKHYTDSRCSSFFSGMSVLTLALCARLSWLPVSF